MNHLILAAVLFISPLKAQVAEKMNCVQVTSNLDIDAEKAQDKLEVVASIKKMNVPQFKKVRLVKGNRAFYNKLTDEILLPVDTPNFYLVYATYHEAGHVIFNKKGVSKDDIQALKHLIDTKTISLHLDGVSTDYAASNDEELFCDLVSYYMRGNKVDNAVKTILDKYL